MSVQLKLDTGAVNALFPEGTQARVDLQQCVMMNIARANLSKAMRDDFAEKKRRTTLDI